MDYNFLRVFTYTRNNQSTNRLILWPETNNKTESKYTNLWLALIEMWTHQARRRHIPAIHEESALYVVCPQPHWETALVYGENKKGHNRLYMIILIPIEGKQKQVYGMIFPKRSSTYFTIDMSWSRTRQPKSSPGVIDYRKLILYFILPP